MTTPNKYWYIEYEDGRVDGGLINCKNAAYVAETRIKNGHKVKNILYRTSNEMNKVYYVPKFIMWFIYKIFVKTNRWGYVGDKNTVQVLGKKRFVIKGGVI